MQFHTYTSPHLDDDDDDWTNNWALSKPRLHLNLAYLEHYHHLNQQKGEPTERKNKTKMDDKTV